LKVLKFFPLGPEEIVFLKIFFVELHVEDSALLLGGIGQDWVTFLVMLEALVYGPPPSVLFEKLNHERRVVSFTYESTVELEL
jgi:hypothetical protein